MAGGSAGETVGGSAATCIEGGARGIGVKKEVFHGFSGMHGPREAKP